MTRTKAKKSAPSAVAMHVFGGGFLVGAERNFDVLADLETFEMFSETVRSNRPKLRHELDPDAAWNLSEWRGVDVLFGNPRCSGFSVINVGHEKSGSRGPDSKQTIDLRQFWKAAKEMRPKFAVFESVQQCGRIGRPLLDQIYGDLESDYRFAEVYFDNARIGVPQRRKRFFGVWYRKDQSFSLRPLPKRETPTVDQTFGDLETRPATPIGKNVKMDGRIDPTNGLKNHQFYELYRIYTQDLIESLEAGESLYDLSDEDLGRSPVLLEKRRAGKGFGWAPLTRMRGDRPANVIYSRSFELVHPRLHRPITVREAARLMGFPDSYGFVGANGFAQLGNGVAVQVGEWISGEIARCLADPPKKDTVIVWDSKAGKAFFEDSSGAKLKQYFINKL